jgi:hypothetical protein
LRAQAHEQGTTRGRGLHRGHERHLVLGPATGPAADALSAEIGIVERVMKGAVIGVPS